MTLLEPPGNALGRDVTAHLPDPGRLEGVVTFRPEDDAVWQEAVQHLHVRDNDVHTVHSYALASALCDLVPEADRDVVLPAIILHDTGWSRVPPDEVLDAIAPGGSRPDLVLRHEKEGADIARLVLERLSRPTEVVEAVVAIVDGHDTRREAISLDDAVVKDADKLWRLTPHGVDTVMGWFGLDREQAHRLIASRVHDHLLTEPGRIMARALAAVVSTDTSPQRRALD